MAPRSRAQRQAVGESGSLSPRPSGSLLRVGTRACDKEASSETPGSTPGHACPPPGSLAPQVSAKIEVRGPPVAWGQPFSLRSACRGNPETPAGLMEGPALDLKALPPQLHVPVVQEEGLEGLLLWGDSTCSLGNPGATICRVCSPPGGHVLELHFPWEGVMSGQEDPEWLPAFPSHPQGVKAGSSFFSHRGLIFQSQKEDLKNMVWSSPLG